MTSVLRKKLPITVRKSLAKTFSSIAKLSLDRASKMLWTHSLLKASAWALVSTGTLVTAAVAQQPTPARFVSPDQTRSARFRLVETSSVPQTNTAVRQDGASQREALSRVDIPVNPLRPQAIPQRNNYPVQQASLQTEDGEVPIEIPTDYPASQDNPSSVLNLNGPANRIPFNQTNSGAERVVPRAQLQPMDDPYDDQGSGRLHSVPASPVRMRSDVFRKHGFHQGSQEPMDEEKGEDGEKESNGSKETDQDDADRKNTLPRPRQSKSDRTVPSNCSDIESKVLTNSLSNIVLSVRPVALEKQTIPEVCRLAPVGSLGRCWAPQTVTWTASALCHKPLYFEDVELERYGHTPGPGCEHIRSGAHFLASTLLLPYQMGIHPPNECYYALGYFRPGDCAPYLRPAFPYSWEGGILQASTAVALPFLIP